MNAKYTLQEQLGFPSAPAGNGRTLLPGTDSDGMLLSALLDGELSEAELNDWLACDPDMGDIAPRVQTHQFIGDALRGQSPRAVGTPASAFLAGVQARLLDEAPPKAVPTPALVPPPLADVPQVRAPAANDSVFRWKLVAGLASLAAVMAVGWNVLETTPAGTGVSGPQLALSQPQPDGAAASVRRSQVATAATPLTVNTSQGVLIRDAELEALMAEHRQHGGVSALQMPAGFLRDATFDPNAR